MGPHSIKGKEMDSAVSKYVIANGAKLHYKEYSTYGQPLLFIHGITRSHNSWGLIPNEFIQDHNVISLDLRGHGLSEKPDHGYSWREDYAEDISDFISTSFNQPAVLVGHSLGASVSAAVAEKTPDLVEALILEDPPAFAHDDFEAIQLRFSETIETKRLKSLDRVNYLMETMEISRENAEIQSKNLEMMSENVILELLKGGTTYDSRSVFPKISCPVLIVLGAPALGGVVELSSRDLLASLLPKSKILEWTEVGHGIHSDKPKKFLSEIRSFLASI